MRQLVILEHAVNRLVTSRDHAGDTAGDDRDDDLHAAARDE
jgi:hypothetical protein